MKGRRFSVIGNIMMGVIGVVLGGVIGYAVKPPAFR